MERSPMRVGQQERIQHQSTSVVQVAIVSVWILCLIVINAQPMTPKLLDKIQ
jgi:hypothetical protein